MTTAMQVARYLESKPLWGEVQRQKLLYYSQAWSLTWTGRPLFEDKIQAWAMGPVVPDVWRAGSETLGGRSNLDDMSRAIVDAVYEFYGQYGGKALSELTHREEPWVDARIGVPEGARSTNVVTTDAIRRYFAREALSDSPAPARPAGLDAMSGPRRTRKAVERQRARWRKTLDALADR